MLDSQPGPAPTTAPPVDLRPLRIRRLICRIRRHRPTPAGFLTIEGQLLELVVCGRCGSTL